MGSPDLEILQKGAEAGALEEAHSPDGEPGGRSRPEGVAKCEICEQFLTFYCQKLGSNE